MASQLFTLLPLTLFEQGIGTPTVLEKCDIFNNLCFAILVIILLTAQIILTALILKIMREFVFFVRIHVGNGEFSLEIIVLGRNPNAGRTHRRNGFGPQRQNFWNPNIGFPTRLMIMDNNFRGPHTPLGVPDLESSDSDSEGSVNSSISSIADNLARRTNWNNFFIEWERALERQYPPLLDSEESDSDDNMNTFPSIPNLRTG